MKKFFKILVVFLCIIPCAIITCACNKKENHVSVNVTGDYVAVAQADKEEIVLQLSNLDNNSNFASGVEFYSVISFENDTEIILNGKMQGEGEDLIASMSAKINLENLTERCNYYIKDNTLYINAHDLKVKQEFSSLNGSDIVHLVTIEQLENLISGFENTNLEEYVNGDVTKYKLKCSTSNANLQNNYEIYFIYNQGTLTGLRYIFFSDDIKMDIQMVGYNGEINLPSFEDYIFDPDYGMN